MASALDHGENLKTWTQKLGGALHHPDGFVLSLGEDGGFRLESNNLQVHTKARSAVGQAKVHAHFMRATHPIRRERESVVGIFYSEERPMAEHLIPAVADEIRDVLRYPVGDDAAEKQTA